LFWDQKPTPEEEERFIRKAAEIIHKYGMDTVAIMFLDMSKPLVYIGGQLGRFFISPFLLMFSEKMSSLGEKFFTIFEKRENVEKLIKLLEDMTKEESEKAKKEKGSNVKEGCPKKRGWRRMLPL